MSKLSPMFGRESPTRAWNHGLQNHGKKGSGCDGENCPCPRCVLLQGILRDYLLRRRWALKFPGNTRKRQLIRSLFSDPLPEGHPVGRDSFFCLSGFRRAQSTRTAKFDPRTLSRKCSRKCPRECTRKCPRRLRLFLCKAQQRVPTKTPTRVLTGKFPVLTGNCPVLTKMYTKVSSVNFHMSYFHMFCFLAMV